MPCHAILTPAEPAEAGTKDLSTLVLMLVGKLLFSRWHLCPPLEFTLLLQNLAENRERIKLPML